jgi:Mrp family chromosome partitioning ATPase
MERLEVALEKARESRRNVQRQTTTAEPAPAKPGVAELWHGLKEFKVSNLGARKHRITTLDAGKNATTYDLLRSRTMRLMQEHGWKSVAVTSPNADCGKTTVCANLAFSLARQPDVKVMVFDFDLRRPALHKVLSQRPANSFYEVLEGKIRAGDQLLRHGDNLAFGFNSRAGKNPSEMLQSKSAHEKLREVIHDYEPDYVIYDLPPMLASDDHVGFLPHADCGLLVSAAESTTVAQLDACEKELAGLTNVLGVVLNKCRFPGGEGGYEQDYY